ncbi:hypothetical protein V8E52_008121 [Russula decolorans]|jgi:hypothetical protein
MADKVFKILKAHSFAWTSADIFRIGYKGEEKPVILWIGIFPGALTDTDNGVPLQAAGKVAIACEQLLESHDVYRYAGPLVPPYKCLTLAVDVQVSGSFTPTI